MKEERREEKEKLERRSRS
jgi:hypothetical protein